MKYKYLIPMILILLSLLLLVSGCTDIELGHNHEAHDHDGDGIPDHASEDHLNGNKTGDYDEYDEDYNH